MRTLFILSAFLLPFITQAKTSLQAVPQLGYTLGTLSGTSNTYETSLQGLTFGLDSGVQVFQGQFIGLGLRYEKLSTTVNSPPTQSNVETFSESASVLSIGLVGQTPIHSSLPIQLSLGWFPISQLDGRRGGMNGYEFRIGAEYLFSLGVHARIELLRRSFDEFRLSRSRSINAAPNQEVSGTSFSFLLRLPVRWDLK